MEALTVNEKKLLADCELVIRANVGAFIEVGAALMKIRDERLYRNGFATFEEYCRRKWHISKTHVNRLIDSSKIVDNLAPIGVIPERESHARELTRLSDPENQKRAWEQALRTAEDEGRAVTARDVEAAVDTVLDENQAAEPGESGDGGRELRNSMPKKKTTYTLGRELEVYAYKAICHISRTLEKIRPCDLANRTGLKERLIQLRDELDNAVEKL